MPNVVIEHSKDIQNKKPLMQLCHDHLLDTGLFTLDSIKVRTIEFDEYLVGGESDKSFIAINVAFMPGRPEDKRLLLGKSLHSKVIEMYAGQSVATSVLIEETPEGMYFK